MASDSDSEKVVSFCLAQTHKVEKKVNPEVIWDSGSTIVLTKEKSFLENIMKCNVTMCSNEGNRSIMHEGDWPGVGQSYLDEDAITNILSQSEGIKRGY